MAASSDLPFSPKALAVAIVDDHDPIRKGIKRVLVAMGFVDIIECHGGEDALKLLAKRPVDLVILDLFMRGVSGFDVLEHIKNRELGGDLPVLVVTGEASKEEIVKVADMGAEDYLLKPFQAQDLERKVAKVLNQFHAPSQLVATLREAERHYLERDYKTAIAAFDQALTIDRESARATQGKALTLDKLGRVEEALAVLQGNLDVNLSYHRSYGTLADILLREGRLKEGLQALRRELEINPKQPNRQVYMAKLLLKESDSIGAIEHFRLALQEDPKRPLALLGMAQAYAHSDNLDKAIYYCKRLRRVNPKSTKALEAGVRFALAANDPRKGELMLRDEKLAHPQRLDTYLLLAMLYLKLGRDDDASLVASDLLGQSPEHPQGLKIKASILIKQQAYDQALVVLETTARVAPSAEVYATIGEALFHLNRVPESMTALHRAIDFNPTGFLPFLLLADIHRQTRQWLKASLLYRRAAQLGADRGRCMAQARACAQEIEGRRRRIGKAS